MALLSSSSLNRENSPTSSIGLSSLMGWVGNNVPTMASIDAMSITAPGAWAPSFLSYSMAYRVKEFFNIKNTEITTLSSSVRDTVVFRRL